MVASNDIWGYRHHRERPDKPRPKPLFNFGIMSVGCATCRSDSHVFPCVTVWKNGDIEFMNTSHGETWWIQEQEGAPVWSTEC